MFPLTRVIYMPLSPSTTFLQPISTDCSASSTISLYNPPIYNPSFPIANFEQKSYSLKRIPQRKRWKFNETNKNALMLLYDVQPSIEYKLISRTGPSHRPTFTMSVEIHGRIFQGTGPTKREAKQAAAEKALRSFSKFEHPICNPSRLLNPIKEENTNLSDRITSCVQEKFKQLTEHDTRLQRRKVLAGIVLTENLQSMKIICITTGTKSITNDHRTNNGQSLNDCHAEILARRCLIRYCYQQLRLLFDGKFDQSIFQNIEGTNRFRLKPSMNFHLYISMVPCGDSRIFALQDIDNGKSSVRKSRGVLRRKFGINDGTIPIVTKNFFSDIHTPDDDGQLVTMSCSDKLCRWNFIGLQGALLSQLIEPIYYASLVVGSLHRKEHLQQSLCVRIEEGIEQLPAPYGVRRPLILGVSQPEIRNTIRASHYALIWNCIDEKCEFIDTFTGLTVSHEISTISKIKLFEQWYNLMCRIKSINEIPTSYSEAKGLAIDYQIAKMQVIQAFENNGLGQWIRKSLQCDTFDLLSSIL